MGKVKLTIDVQLVDFSLDRPLLLCLSRDELAFDGSDQTSTDRVELGVKFRSVHLPSLAVRLVIYVLFSIAEGGRLTCCGELIELFKNAFCDVNYVANTRKVKGCTGFASFRWDRGSSYKTHFEKAVTTIS